LNQEIGTYMTMAFTTLTPQAPRTPQATQPTARTVAQPTLDNRIKAALEHARRLTALYGTDNIEVAIAWETVEELQGAKSRQMPPGQSTFARYCAENPEAPECRIYGD
jgi:hypothetical protein